MKMKERQVKVSTMLNEWSQTPFTYKRISLLKAFDQKITVCAGKLAPKLNQISKKVQWESIFPQDVFFSDPTNGTSR